MATSKKGSEDKSERKKVSGTEKQIRILAILLFIISVFLFIALISYSFEDESNIQMKSSEIVGLVSGDEVAQIKAESVENWLGLVGAYVSYFIYNKTFGFIAIFIPFILFRWGYDLLKHTSITKPNLRDTLFYIFGALFFSGLMGTIFALDWIDPFPKEWAGSVGLYLSYLMMNLMGATGSFLIFLIGLATIVIFGFKLNTEKLYKGTISLFDHTKDMIIEKTESIKDSAINVIKKENEVESPELKDNDIKEKADKSDSYKSTPTQKEIEELRINKQNVQSNPTEDYYNKKSVSLTKDSILDEKENEIIDAIAKDNMTLNLNKDEPSINSDNDTTEFTRTENPIGINDLADEPDSPICTYIHDEKIKYVPPGLDLLEQNYEIHEVSEAELKMNAEILRDKLETFKITIENLSVTPGPVVTQYEFVPSAGIKISKIESLSDDLAMALKAKGIRIIAPIPGRGTVGIEIPNSQPSMVSFTSVINTKKFRDSSQFLPLALGKTINGEAFITDLAKMPHLLIAGSTGSGKSVGINTIIASLLYQKMPDELKFVIIDPKKVELTQYAALSNHYLASSPDVKDMIITDPEEAVAVLKSLVLEMEERYTILSNVGQRNLVDYNNKVAEGKYDEDTRMKHRKMPYIVCVIDELADLMLTASKEIESPIIRLAQMARAVGIHLILATQRPSVDVITGIIKANFPARIGFLVASRIDSRTILDMGGAEKLLGNGDLLYLSPGSPKPIRVQNSFISTDEVERICEHIHSQKGYSMPYQLPSTILKNRQSANDYDASDTDELFEEAGRIIIETQTCSVSMLQRKLRVGYARAGKIVDELERAGVVGTHNGSKPRDVLMESQSEFDAIL
ncbi:DNA translocase FtsK [bacterium]|nr:MAG: DNA translocase FtsK [bacterium]